MIKPEEIILDQTCGACPEQYDAYYKDTQVGYLRLRHGFFRAECFDEVVYTSDTNGDGLFDDDEREFYLESAKKAICDHMNLDHL